jgi:hypothetical protein
MAAGAVNTARQLGLAFGIAVLGSVYQGRIPGHGAAAALGTMFAVAGAAGVAAGLPRSCCCASRPHRPPPQSPPSSAERLAALSPSDADQLVT